MANEQILDLTPKVAAGTMQLEVQEAAGGPGSSGRVPIDDAIALLIDDAAAPSTGKVWSSEKTNAAVTAAGTGGTNQPLLNGLVSGGFVINTGNLDFASGTTVYYINGVLLTAAGQTVSLAAADPGDDRFDVIALDDTGTLIALTGTPAANPSVPTIDPSTQLALTIVSVPAGATTVPGVANEDIYDTGAVWAITTNGTTWATASAAFPLLGATAISATALTNGAWIRFNRGSGEALDATDILNFQIQSLATWPNKRTMLLQWRDTNNAAIGQAVTLKSGAYGFDSSATGVAQLVTIPLAAFAIPAGAEIQYLQMTNAGGAIGFGLNPIGIQSVGDVVIPPTAGGITQGQADARYVQLPFATAGQFTAGAETLRPLAPGQVWDAAEAVALVDGATVNWNLAAGLNWSWTIDGNRTLANPTNPKQGQNGCIEITQDAPGGHTITFDSDFIFRDGDPPTLSTATGARDLLFYYVTSDLLTFVGLQTDVKP